YIDVLEHIEDDRGEVARAAAHLVPGGRLVVLSPAHAWLYSDFDAAIGHFRRYDGKSLRALTPPSLKVKSLRYLDSAGLAASGANRFLLRQSMPGRAQIAFWDKCLVPMSRVTDALSAGRLGKSVVAVWERAADHD